MNELRATDPLRHRAGRKRVSFAAEVTKRTASKGRPVG
jgi:hypothetical protein